MLYASLLIVLLIVALLVYALSTNAKVSELARLTFAASIFAVAFQLGSRLVTLLR